MTLPSSGTLSLSDLQTEFTGSHPISMSEYYKSGGNGYVPSTVAEAVTASSGAAPLKLSNLQFADANNSNDWYGKCKQVLVFNEALSDSELATLTS